MGRKLKSVFILGPKISIDSSFMEKYKGQDYLIIGDGKRDINLSELDQLKGRIDFSTRVDLCMHGNRIIERGQKHHISKIYSSGNPVRDSEIYRKLAEASEMKPLNIFSWSCYGGTASHDITYLPSGSVLTSYSPNNNVTPSRINENEILNSAKPPINLFMDNIIKNISSSFHISANSNGERVKLAKLPDLEQIFNNPHKAIKSFLDHYNNSYKKINPAAKDFQLKVTPAFIKDFQLAAFQGYCLKIENDSSVKSNKDKFKLAKIEKILGSLNKTEIQTVFENIFAKFPNLEVVKLFVNKGINLNCFNEYGGTPLTHLAYNNDKEGLELLIKKGANINRANKAGVNALDYAKLNGNREIVDFLVKLGAVNNKSDKEIADMLKQKAAIELSNEELDLYENYQTLPIMTQDNEWGWF